MSHERGWSTIDKSTWGDGPWMAEPDKVQWVDDATGLDCLAVRHPRSGNWCGYVGVAPTHPLHGVGYSQDVAILGQLREARLNQPMGEKAGMGLMLGVLMGDVKASPDCVFDVHGGLTFADACCEGEDESRGICHVPVEGRPANVWWFGFDCAHSGDYSPGYDNEFRALFGDRAEYRTLDYVKSEAASLARQLAALLPGSDQSPNEVVGAGR